MTGYIARMDINLLALNVGNSRVAFGVFSTGALEEVTRLPHEDEKKVVQAISAAWRKLAERGGVAAIVGASVNPPVADALEQAVEHATHQRIAWVGKEIELPINVLTEPPQETGVDRVLNVAAAFEQMEKACVVVDAGTAITLSVCNHNGDFLGGAIAPGVSMMLDALHRNTAKLPRVQFSVPKETIGRSTHDAILNGVYHGVRGMVKELVENYAVELGFWPDIIATGGDAAKLFEGWELVHAISPDLTLYGVALAYAEHHIRHETGEDS
jgi:type III pantothenate kinase